MKLTQLSEALNPAKRIQSLLNAYHGSKGPERDNYARGFQKETGVHPDDYKEPGAAPRKPRPVPKSKPASRRRPRSPNSFTGIDDDGQEWVNGRPWGVVD